jgi:hypothetical protein
MYQNQVDKNYFYEIGLKLNKIECEIKLIKSEIEKIFNGKHFENKKEIAIVMKHSDRIFVFWKHPYSPVFTLYLEWFNAYEVKVVNVQIEE